MRWQPSSRVPSSRGSRSCQSEASPLFLGTQHSRMMQSFSCHAHHGRDQPFCVLTPIATLPPTPLCLIHVRMHYQETGHKRGSVSSAQRADLLVQVARPRSAHHSRRERWGCTAGMVGPLERAVPPPRAQRLRCRLNRGARGRPRGAGGRLLRQLDPQRDVPPGAASSPVVRLGAQRRRGGQTGWARKSTGEWASPRPGQHGADERRRRALPL